jgi:uncharacterized protein YjdB
MNSFTKFIRNTLMLLLTASQVQATSTVTANFNGTPISAGRKIWYTAELNITGSVTYPLTIYFTNQTITRPGVTRSVPNAILVLDPSVTTATTVFNGTAWVTTAPPGLSGYCFISGYADSLTSALPGSVSPVSWTGTFTASRPGVSLVWHMAAAVYTSFNSNLNNLGVKPNNCHSCTIYPNADGAGTPENYKSYVIGGARGGGGSNYTGGYSGGDNITCGVESYYNTSLCVGNTATLTPLSVSGSWTSSNASVATVNTTGVVTGVSAGTARISYAISGSSAWQVVNVSVNAAPAITASATSSALCAGASLSLHAGVGGSTSGGGSSGSGGAGGVYGGGGSSCSESGGGSSGSGSSGCTYTFSWHGPASFASTLQDPTRSGMTTTMAGIYSVTVSNGTCSATATVPVTVSTTPVAGTITGSNTVCAGSATAFANASTGGTWSSGNTTVATVSASGIVTGVTPGTSTISYRVTNACGTAYATRIVTVNLLPNAGTISGGSTLCTGTTMALSNATTGGVWTSGNTGVAVVSSAGIVTGVASGTATISYTVTGGCGMASATRVVSVNLTASAGSITGGSSVCAGSAMALSSATTGGVWSSSLPGIASVSSTGMVTGVAAGIATISYSASTSCGTAVATKAVTVNAMPNAGTISGGTSVCTGTSTALSSTVSGGAWSSGSSAIATVTSTGSVTGVTPGTTNISYTVTNGCGTASVATAISVNLSPNAGSITGGSSVCPGAALALSNAIGGGAWSSGNGTVATVDTTGIVTGVAFGSAAISYTVTNGCGTSTATRIVSVNSLPNAGAISGASNVCVGSVTALSNSVGGGVWSSSNPTIATISATGIVSGNTAGAATISYTVTNSCGTASVGTAIMVNSSPNAGSITGGSSACPGSTLALSNLVSGGAWSSGNTAVATVSASGVVTALTPGNATISYTVSSACGSASATNIVSVGSSPNAGSIVGGTAVCVGATTSMGNAVSGGVWSTANAGIASITSTGVVTGVASGTTVVSYTVTNGCGTTSAISTMAVNASANAGAISGGSTVCVGATTGLSSSVSGGAWTSGTSGIATVSASGIVTGVAPGIATISYTVTGGCGSSSATKSISVSPLPDAGTVAGSTSVCTGSVTTLVNCVSGGVWSSGASGTASVSSTGVVIGGATGTTTISYTVTNSCGTVSATSPMTVSASPNAGSITGGTNVCQGASMSLTNAVGGGAWSSGASGVATVSASGMVSGIAPGTATISYVVTNGCGSAEATQVVAVDPLPVAGSIIGNTTVCAGSTTALGSSSGGGAWSTSASSVATVSSTGVVTGVNAGSAIISYIVTNSCGTTNATATVVVNAQPNAGSIAGSSSVCAGATLALSNGATGGAWSSTNAGVATVSSTGVVTAIAAGATTVSYTVTNSCGTASATKAITVNPSADAGTITGSSLVCTGISTTLGVCAGGGAWSSGTPAVAMVSSTGVVTGLSAGTTIISYTVTNSCGTATTTKLVSVNAVPAGLSGPSGVNVGNSVFFTVSGGSWTSSNASVATVDASGNITGVSAGTATISYSVSNSCYSYVTTKVITVSTTTVAAISGTLAICENSTTTLTDATTGGTWSSADPSVATITSTGVVTGVAAGTATISYSVPGAVVTEVVTVNALPSAITGGGVLCAGGSSPLSNATVGGAWTSIALAVATIDPATGVVNGVNSGTATVVYTLPTGCSTSTIINVTSVNPITGTPTVCTGSSTSLANATSGGIWSSSNASIAPVSAIGVVNGLSAGVANITYTAASGCSVMQAVSVLAAPAAISGPASLCAGTTASYTNATPGGTWSSTSANISVGASGNVTGLTAGTATITYTNGVGCDATFTISVNAAPAPITGPSTLCIGGTISLSNVTTGAASWSSSNTAIATIGGTGVVTGVAAGTVAITYALTTGCITTTNITVMSGLSPITGNAPVCAGSTLALSHSTPGGTWTTNNIAVATVGSTGIVTGVAGGTARISYATGGGCSANVVVSVNTILPIAGPNATCVGNTIALTDGTTGGTWSSSDASVATVSATGIVTGVANGTAVIAYTLGNGCSRSVTVTISTMTPITGTTSLCVGLTSSLANATPGGTWSSTPTTIASIGSANGVATGIAIGTAMITYTSGTCKVTTAVSVNGSPATISGSAGVCVGSSGTWTNSTPGGTWSTSSANIAISGVSTQTVTVTGITSGPATLTYTQGVAGCYRVSSINVNPLPAAIGGTYTVCPGGTAQLTDATPAGTWTSADLTKATVGGSGIVTGMATGTAVISYTLGTSCAATTIVTVIAGPSPIVGALNVCTGSTVSLTNPSGPGTWASAPTSVATAGTTTGVITGVSAGTATISFTLAATGCRAKAIMTVTAIPNAGTLSGLTSVAVGSTITLTSSGSAGGAWSSSDATLATVDTAFGTSAVVSGVSTGLATITYSVSNACGFSGAYKPITVTGGALRGMSSGGTTPAGDASVNETLSADPMITNTATVMMPKVQSRGVANVTTAKTEALPIDVRVIPNPNGGTFTITGNSGVVSSEEVEVEITNMLGQVVYRTRVMTQRGVINEQVQMNNNMANGTYMLTIKSRTNSRTFHFVMKH